MNEPWEQLIDVTGHETALLERLNSPEVTPEDVLAYLRYQNSPTKTPEQFFNPAADLANWASACAWWPDTQLPVAIRKPTLLELCFNYATPQHETFMSRLAARAEKAEDWRRAKGPGRPRVHPEIPGESYEERIKRLNREAVARHRERRRSLPQSPHDAAVAEAYAALQAAYAQRREAKAQWDEYVAGLRAAWMALKNNPPEQS